MNPFRHCRFASRSALLLTASALSTPAFSALTWNVAGPTQNWSTAAANPNWLPGNIAWIQNEDAIFSGVAETVTVTTANTFNNITFEITGFTVANGGGLLFLANDFASTITVTNAADTATITESLYNNAFTASSLTKAGLGTLVLGGTAASTYSGQTLITAGTLKAASATALGAGGAGAETIVSSGATFDMGGQAITDTETFRIAGSGVGGNGAVVNHVGPPTNGLNRVELAADATIGGTVPWGIRAGTTPTLDLAGNTLTKKGTNVVALVGATITPGNLTLDGGTLSVETTSLLQGTGTVTINSTGTLGFSQNPAGNVTRSIISNNGTLANQGLDATLDSSVSINGGTTIATGGATSTLTGSITGTGPLAVTGTGTLVLNGTNSYSGGTTITDARVQTGANASAVGDGTITVNGNGAVSDGQFFAAGAVTFPNTKNFIISGHGGNNSDSIQRGAIRLDSGATINGTVTLAGPAGLGSNAGIGTINGAVSGSFDLTKFDAGTILLAGQVSHTGSTTINAGTLALDYTAFNSSKLSDSEQLIFNGGTLSLENGSHAEAVLSTTLAANANAAITRPSGSATINLGPLTRNPKATLDISDEFLAKTGSGTVGEAFGSWLTIGGTSLATRNGSNDLVAVTPDNVSTVAGPNNTITDGLGNVQLIDGAGTVLLGGVAGDTIDVTTITRSVAGIATIDMAGKTLRVKNPGTILSGTGSGGITFGTAANSGTLTAGGPADNTPGMLDFRTIAGTLAIRATIADNGTGAVSVATRGAAWFTGTNTYTGGTVIEGFFHGIDHDAALGAVPASLDPDNIVLNGGTLSSYTGAYSDVTLHANRGITLTSSGGTFDSGGTSTLAVNGIISGSGGVTTSNGGIIALNALNTFTGITTVADGTTLSINTVKHRTDNSGSSLGNVPVIQPGTVALSGRLLYTGTGNETDRVVDMVGTAPVIDHSGTGLLSFYGDFTATGATVKTLTLQGSTSGTGQISGVIPDNSATHTTAVTKDGSGTWTLVGTNTYTGGTIVNGGTLVLGFNPLGIAGIVRGIITVNSGATLSSQGVNTFGTSALNKVNQVDIVNGTYTHTAAGENGWGVIYNLTGGTMQSTNAPPGRFSFGGPVGMPTVVNTLASATTSTIAGRVNLRADNNNHVTFTVADGEAPTDLLLAALVDGMGVNLTKEGAGLMAMSSGSNTYNGTTTVNAGTLLVNGTNSGTGAVTVNATGTVGGTGSVAGTLTVNSGGTVAPGASAGTFTTGATVIDGSYACELDGVNSDKLAVNGNLDINGATLNVSVLGGGATQPEYIIATYTGTLTGTFTLGTPLPPGYAVYHSTFGQIKLVNNASYSSWATSFGLNPATNGAPGFVNSGGFENGTEFILGGSPVSGSNNPKIYSLAADSNDAGTEKELIVTIAVPVGTTAFTAGSPISTASFAGYGITVRGSTTLSSFPVTVNPVAPITTGLPALVSPQGGVNYEYRSLSLGGSNGTPSKGFLQVVVTNP